MSASRKRAHSPEDPRQYRNQAPARDRNPWGYCSCGARVDIKMDEWITFGETKQDVKEIWQALEVWVPYPTLFEGNYACIGAMCVPCMSRMYHNTRNLLRDRPMRPPAHSTARLQAAISRGLIHALNQQLLQKLCRREEAAQNHIKEQDALLRHQEEVLTLASNMLSLIHI